MAVITEDTMRVESVALALNFFLRKTNVFVLIENSDSLMMNVRDS